jgi:primosomal protein N' (replication factor Y)
VVLSGTEEDATARLATRTAAWLHRLLAARPAPGVKVIGPAPCPVERVKNRWRWHVLIKADKPQELGRVARYLVERFEIPKQFGLRMTVDRDPVALL